MVEGDGFEPSKAEPADLQSAPFGHSGTPPGCFILRKCFPNTAFQVFSHDIITRKNMVEGDGFEPSKAEPADLQSAPFGHSGTPPGCFILEKCFPNASLKCGAHHSKLAPAVKRFSSVFTLNAAFLGKDGRKSAFCMSFIQNENILFTGIYTT